MMKELSSRKKVNKNILILHGWDSGSKEHWYMDAKTFLTNKGYKVYVPDMLGAYYPKKEEWLKIVKNFQPDENWILIGHSLGGVTILKYLEQATVKVNKVILIATPYEPMEFTPIANFFAGGFDWEIIKTMADKFIVVSEDNDPLVPLDHGKNYAKKLNCQLIVENGFLHFDKIDLKLLEKIIESI